ncbi:MAG: sugar-transfer associated ATP-grasp domain-containing protein [Opitutaceae bacterium]
MLVEKRTKAASGWPAPNVSASDTKKRAPSSDTMRRAEIQATLRWLDARDKGPMAAASRRTRSALVRRFDRLNAPIVYPWSPSMNGAHPAHRLHRTAATLLRVRSPGAFGKAWLHAKAVAWPVLAMAAAVPVVLRCWKHVRDRHGFGLREQCRDVIDAALNHGIFPTEYYNRRVYASAAREDKSLYINEREMIALLSGADRGSGSPRVDDLECLYAECRKAGILVPRSVAFFSRGSIEIVGGSGSLLLPEKDLFVRPKDWTVDAPGEYWRWMPKARAWSFDGETLVAAALLKRVRMRCLAHPCVLQEAVANHPEVARFSQGGLCSYKVAAGVDPQGNPHVLFASFRFPGADLSGESAVSVDLTSGVDIVSGRLLPAVGEFVTDGEFDNHPATSAIITGAAAPHWREVAALALKAHRLFADVPFIGWEIGVGANGPIVLDASSNWGFFPHVLPSETKFASFCVQHLMRGRQGDLDVPVFPPSQTGGEAAFAPPL